MNQELQDVQAGFRKGRGTKGQIAKICCITEKLRQQQSEFPYTYTHIPDSPITDIFMGKFLTLNELILIHYH